MARIQKRRYRPAKTNVRGPWVRLTTCYDPEQAEAIHAVAKRKDCTAAQAIRHLVDVGLAVEQDAQISKK